MLLSDSIYRDLIKREYIKVSPMPPEEAFGPASLDVRLGKNFYIARNTIPVLDIKEKNDIEEVFDYIEVEDSIIIPSGGFILGTTIEYFELPDDIAAILSGRSSLGRVGIVIHATAGFIDPGFHGKITLEISNVNVVPVKLYVGMRIGQVHFHAMPVPATNPYYKGHKYDKQNNVQLSQIYKDFQS